MTATREELREHLLATLEAAPELPRDGREHLADVFLDELQTRYRLVPRPASQSWNDNLFLAWSALLRSARGWFPLLAGAVGVLFLVPLLLLPVFVLFHAPFLVFVLFFLFLGVGRHRMWRHSYWR